MKAKETILNNISKSLKLSNEVENNYTRSESEQFYDNAKDYIKAIKNGRMINSIGSVSKSGMSRTFKFLSCEVNKNNCYYRNYYTFFIALGYNANNDNFFRVNGCGMDMIFHTNYTIIHNLHNLGFLSKKQTEILAQKTPTTI